jgi:AbrB family looped-hinge helix DNA binding protein
MTAKGQLKIPKNLRDELDLAVGTRLFVTIRDGQIVAYPKNRKAADLFGIPGNPPAGEGASIKEMDEAVGEYLSDDGARIRATGIGSKK